MLVIPRLSLCLFILSGPALAFAQPAPEAIFSAGEGTQISGVTPAGDGSTYVVLSAGGPFNQGALARYAADGRVSVVHGFEGPDGAQPMAAVIFGQDGALYGTTNSGGKNGFGTIFRVSTRGEFSSLHHFTAEQGGGSRAPLSLAADGGMYGVTYGVYHTECVHSQCRVDSFVPGAVFKVSTDGALRILYSGVFAPGDGGVIEASTGDLYGGKPVTLGQQLTDPAGEDNAGIYRLTPDGQMTFNITAQPLGFNPSGTLLEASDGYLYGVSDSPSWNPRGPRVFRFSPFADSADLEYHELATAGQGKGGLAFGTDGNLYGRNLWSMFRLSASGILTRLFDTGAAPLTAAMKADGRGHFVTASALDLLQYTQAGGGSILHHFDYQAGHQFHSLIVSRSGLIYGLTNRGGAHDAGTVFRGDGTGATTSLYDLPELRGGGIDSVRSRLIEADDGSLYLLTNAVKPALIKLAPHNSAWDMTLLHEFDVPAQDYSFGGDGELLALDRDGVLYGTISLPDTQASDSSQLYRLDPKSGKLHVLATLDSLRSILRAASGEFYGWKNLYLQSGSVSQLFRVSSNGAMTVLYQFPTSADGYVPASSLVEAADGSVYGYARGKDGLSQLVYRWTPAQTFEIVYHYPSDKQLDGFIQLGVGRGGALYLWARYYPWSSTTEAPSSVLLPNGEMRWYTEHSFGTVISQQGDAYRIAPITRNGYDGIRLEPID